MKVYVLCQVKKNGRFIEEYIETVKEATSDNLQMLKAVANDIYSKLSKYDQKKTVIEIREIETINGDDMDAPKEEIEGAENYDVIYIIKNKL